MWNDYDYSSEMGLKLEKVENPLIIVSCSSYKWPAGVTSCRISSSQNKRFFSSWPLRERRDPGGVCELRNVRTWLVVTHTPTVFTFGSKSHWDHHKLKFCTCLNADVTCVCVCVQESRHGRRQLTVRWTVCRQVTFGLLNKTGLHLSPYLDAPTPSVKQRLFFPGSPASPALTTGLHFGVYLGRRHVGGKNGYSQRTVR